MAQEPKQQEEGVRFDRQLSCEHDFFAMITDKITPKAGETMWFYCRHCLLLSGKVLEDQSGKL